MLKTKKRKCDLTEERRGPLGARQPPRKRNTDPTKDNPPDPANQGLPPTLLAKDNPQASKKPQPICVAVSISIQHVITPLSNNG